MCLENQKSSSSSSLTQMTDKAPPAHDAHDAHDLFGPDTDPGRPEKGPGHETTTHSALNF
jgi:hypothetical protein